MKTQTYKIVTIDKIRYELTTLYQDRTKTGWVLKATYPKVRAEDIFKFLGVKRLV